MLVVAYVEVHPARGGYRHGLASLDDVPRRHRQDRRCQSARQGHPSQGSSPKTTPQQVQDHHRSDGQHQRPADDGQPPDESRPCQAQACRIPQQDPPQQQVEGHPQGDIQQLPREKDAGPQHREPHPCKPSRAIAPYSAGAQTGEPGPHGGDQTVDELDGQGVVRTENAVQPGQDIGIQGSAEERLGRRPGPVQDAQGPATVHGGIQDGMGEEGIEGRVGDLQDVDGADRHGGQGHPDEQHPRSGRTGSGGVDHPGPPGEDIMASAGTMPAPAIPDCLTPGDRTSNYPALRLPLPGPVHET